MVSAFEPTSAFGPRLGFDHQPDPSQQGSLDGHCAFGLKSAHTIKMRVVGELAPSHVRVGEPHTPSSKCGSGSAPDHGGERTLLTRTWQLFMSPADSAGAGGGIVGRQSRVAFDF